MNRPRRKILFVASNCPFAPSYGTQMRMLSIARILKRVGDVSFVITDNYEREFDRYIAGFEFDVRLIARLTRSRRRRASDWVRQELASGWLATEGFEVCEADRRAMAQLMAEADICWVHGVRTANMFGIYHWPRSILDIDDIPSRFYASRAGIAASAVDCIKDYRRALLWWNRERLLKKRFSVVAVVSENDRRYLGGRTHAAVIPNGFDLPPEQDARVAAAEFPRVGFIGKLKWLPNRDGIEWFIKYVWPHVKREAPEARLRLVGEGSDGPIERSGPDIDGLGWIENPAAEIASWSAMVVPLRCGAGTRVKIVEGFSRKCPVVSTSLGAFGREVLNGEDILLADNPKEFASACLLLLKDAKLGAKLRENAWNKFLHKWTWDAIGEAVLDAVDRCQSIGPRPEPQYGLEDAVGKVD